MAQRFLFLCLLAAALLGAPNPPHAEPRYPGPYAMELIRVIDGDTLLARVALWPDIELTVYVRLRGIDAPELREGEAGVAAREALVRLVEGESLTLLNPKPGKYARRVIADVRLGDGRDLRNQLKKFYIHENTKN